MKKYIMAHPAIFITTVLLGILSQGTVTATSLFLMFIIDSITSADMANLVVAAYFSVGVILLFFVSIFAYTRFTVLYSYKTVLKLKSDIFSAILTTKISDFNQSNSAKHISLINNDIQMVNEKYIQSILAMTKDISTMIFALGAMAFLSPINALIALILSSSPIIMPILFGNQLSKTNVIYMKKMALLNEKVKDFLLGFEVIKTFGIEKNIKIKFVDTAATAENARYKAGKISVKVGSFSGTILVATQIITYLVAGYFVITGSITIGAVIAIAGLSSSIMQPIQYVSINLANIKSTKDVRKRLLRVMEPKDTRKRTQEANFSNGIDITNLSFKYEADRSDNDSQVKKAKPQIKMLSLAPGQSAENALSSMGVDSVGATFLDSSNLNPDQLDNILGFSEKSAPDTKIINAPQINSIEDLDIAAILKANGITDVDLSQVKVLQVGGCEVVPPGAILKNISYSFKPGGKYAIVGSSGSGKSTLLRLLMGYYDNYLGSVSINGHEIRDIDRETLYKSLAMMHQNVFLLDDTLYNNITLDNDYTDEEYTQAIGKARLDTVIASLPDGSLSKVGDGGNSLSGGERQRVAIARAFIKGCDVIIMDEATSNLDNETAYEIEKSLLEAQSLTCIYVTHRYTADLLRQCDGILVLHNGELVESGSFNELYEKKEFFYSLYNISGR